AHPHVDAAWYALIVIGLVIAIDIARTVASARAARRYRSAALSSNALHFASDLGGSTAVLVGLLFVRAGYPDADSIAALFVACIVLAVAVRLMRGNVDVLMDRVPAQADAAALNVRRVREVHNVTAVSVGSGMELSLHVKLPGDLSLEEAHEIAEEVERAIREAVPEVSAVQTHLEPLAEEAAGTRPEAGEVETDRAVVGRIVRDESGTELEELRFVHTDEGLVAYLTLRLGSDLVREPGLGARARRHRSPAGGRRRDPAGIETRRRHRPQCDQRLHVAERLAGARALRRQVNGLRDLARPDRADAGRARASLQRLRRARRAF